MKVLQFCKKTPIPPKDGESIAINQLSKAFVNNGCELHVYSLLTEKHPKTLKSSHYIENVKYTFTKINSKISFFGVLKNLLFSKKPYIVKRFENNKVEKDLIELLKKENFDIVQLEGVFLGNYIKIIRAYSNAKIVFRAHNVENEIWKLLSENEKFFKKVYLKQILIPRLEKFEKRISKEVDCIIPISKVDEAFFTKNASNTNIKTIPVAYEVLEYENILQNQFNVGFIGGLDWLPNQEGVKWFLKNVWRKFVLKKNKANFNLAGRNFPKKYYNLKDTNLYIYGEIENAREFTLENSVMIAPILSGSGMRVKIIEALALGRTVLSTKIGAEGIDYENNKNIFVADTAEEWIEILLKLSNDKLLLIETGKAGQELIKRNHDILKLGTELVDFYKNTFD